MGSPVIAVLAVVVRRLVPAAEANIPDEEERARRLALTRGRWSADHRGAAVGVPRSELQVGRPSLAALPADT
jgi:hypothetical protein